MYLPKYCTDEDGHVFHDIDDLVAGDEVKKHDGISYCPWCYDPLLKHKVRKGCAYDVNSSIYVLDDRLYDYITNPDLLMYCVKISHLIQAFTDPIYELVREDHVPESDDTDDDEERKFRPPKSAKYKQKPIDEVESKSPLCYTLRELRLPNDNADSKAWILPLLLDSMPSLVSLGETCVYDGLKIMCDLKKTSRVWPKRPLKLEEIHLRLEEATLEKTLNKHQTRLTSLTSWFPKWSTFCEAKLGQNCLEHWVQTNLQNDLIRPQNLEKLYETWKLQIETIVKTCPLVKKIKLFVKAGVLSSDSTEIWEPLVDLKHLEELQIHCSCKATIMSLLKVIGKKLSHLKLYFNNNPRDHQIVSDENPICSLINVVPHYCPKLEKVLFGYLQSNAPHGITREDKYGTVWKVRIHSVVI